MAIHVDESPEDAVFVEQFKKDLDMLIGMVEEMFVDNKVLLLSPILREVIIEKSRTVESRWSQIKQKIHVDNPCHPLKQYFAKGK